MKRITTVALLLCMLLAPALALEDINEPGKKTSVKQHFEEGKKTMVFFYARWDKTANRLQVELDRFDQVDEEWKILRVRLKTLKDPVAGQYAISQVPAFLLYDEKGNLMAQGATAYSEVLKMLEANR